MGEREITRRQVLAGVAGVGGVGSVLGGGTAALFTDGEIFEGSSLQSGTVDLAVTATSDGEEYAGNGEVSVPLELEKEIFVPDELDQPNVADSRAAGESTDGSDGTQIPERPGEASTPTEAPPSDTPTSTPEQTETPTPESTETSTPEPTARPTPEPTETSTPPETPTPSPTPGGTSTPSTNVTSTPTPERTATPTETPTGEGRPAGPTGGGGPSTFGGNGRGRGKYGGGPLHGGFDHPPLHELYVWRDTFQATVSLPDLEGENNAAFGWIRAQCPEDDLTAELDVTIRYADGGSDALLYSGPVGGLAGGIPLDPDGNATLDDGEQRCFEPPESDGSSDAVDLEIVVEHEYPEDDVETAFTLEFVATQCRHDQASNPFSDVPDCETPGEDHEEAFSFVGFCTRSDESIDPTFERVAGSGPSDAVAWSTATPVDFVIVKKALWYTIYDLRDEPASEGVLAWKDPGADEPAVPFVPGSPSYYCRFASSAVGAVDYDPEKSEKVDWEDVTWEGDT